MRIKEWKLFQVCWEQAERGYCNKGRLLLPYQRKCHLKSKSSNECYVVHAFSQELKTKHMLVLVYGKKRMALWQPKWQKNNKNEFEKLLKAAKIFCCRLVSRLLERAEAERLSVGMWSHLFKQLRKGKGTVSPEQSTAVQGGTQGTNPGAENAAETETYGTPQVLSPLLPGPRQSPGQGVMLHLHLPAKGWAAALPHSRKEGHGGDPILQPSSPRVFVSQGDLERPWAAICYREKIMSGKSYRS